MRVRQLKCKSGHPNILIITQSQQNHSQQTSATLYTASCPVHSIVALHLAFVASVASGSAESLNFMVAEIIRIMCVCCLCLSHKNLNPLEEAVLGNLLEKAHKAFLDENYGKS
eukprot:g80295.t1